MYRVTLLLTATGPNVPTVSKDIFAEFSSKEEATANKIKRFDVWALKLMVDKLFSEGYTSVELRNDTTYLTFLQPFSNSPSEGYGYIRYYVSNGTQGYTINDSLYVDALSQTNRYLKSTIPPTTQFVGIYGAALPYSGASSIILQALTYEGVLYGAFTPVSSTFNRALWALCMYKLTEVPFVYRVIAQETRHGSVSFSTTTYTSSADITVNFTPDPGYRVDWLNTHVIDAAATFSKTSDVSCTIHADNTDITFYPAFMLNYTARIEYVNDHGTAALSEYNPIPGEIVTVTTYPDYGYQVKNVTVNGNPVSKATINTYKFTMPEANAVVSVEFETSPYYNITVEEATNGNVTAYPMYGYSGTTIRLTIQPDTGYAIKRLYVLAGIDNVPVTKVDDTHYTFVLPSFNVVVRALFWDGDPYSPGGSSNPSDPGGTGNFDNTTIPITPPSIPSVSLQDTGLYTIFSLTQGQFNDFNNYLWSNLFSLPTATKYLNNATDHILSLHILPFNVDAGSSREIKFMGIGTGTNGSVITRQYQQIDCGSVLLEEYYGSALDYNPWTKLKLYVPYCGEIELDPDEIMGQAVSLKYTIDILTGDCYANVGVSGTTMYQLSGNCAMRLPVSASNWSSVLRAAASGLAIAAGVGAAAMGAVGAGLTAAGAEAFRVSNEAMGTRAGDTAFGEAVALGRAGKAVTERIPQVGSTNSYMATMAQKSSFIHTGLQTGGASFMAVQVPYILIKRPRQALPENFNHYVGYPAHYTRTLGNMSGFTQIVDWNPISIPCTESERTEIDRLLKEGVIL